MRPYVEAFEGAYRIAGTRVTLDSIVYAFREGLIAESIRDNFSVLTLEEVYGAITFYLAHKSEVDKHLAEGQQRSDRLRQESQKETPCCRHGFGRHDVKVRFLADESREERSLRLE